MSGIFPPRDLPIRVEVSDHARLRARERFPGFKSARIVDEVRLAIREGRLSSKKPEGFGGTAHSTCLYAWTSDGERLYALKHNDDCLYVTTTVRRKVAA